jgi:2'-5' RNA ligase
VDGGDRLRLFCALCLPSEALDAVVRWQGKAFPPAQLRGGARAVSRENLHLTLAFLGSQSEDDVPAIAAALGDAVGGAHDLRLRLRGYRETRSVGMLTFDDDGGRAAALAGRLHEALEGLDLYRRENRPWLAHLTVLRFREPPRLRPALPELGEVAPSDAAVYMSRLRPGGAQYTVLRRFRLENAPLGG